jgi:hypothetical protein
VLLPDREGGGSREMIGRLSLREAIEHAGRQAVRFAPCVVVVAIDGHEIGREEVG